MSQVHDDIALAALSVQEKELKKVFDPYIEEFKKSSWYPDKVNKIRKNNPEEIRFLFPAPPKTLWQRELEKISEKYCPWCGEPALGQVYLCGYYLKNAVRSLKDGDIKSAIKFCGVYSHLIADIIEPGHAVFDWFIDVFEPVSNQHPDREIFTNKECLRGSAVIKGYRPKLLGGSIKQAELGAVSEILNGSRFGAALAIPMERELYAGNIEKAREFSSRAQSEAARKFADFIYTVFYLARQNKATPGSSIDLCKLPFISAEISCYCRFRPLVDIFLDPSHFDNSVVAHFILKTQPLILLSEDGGEIEQVHGLCVMPRGIKSKATVEYLLVPGAYSKFSAKVGFNPAFKKSLAFLSAVFTVIGDGKKLASSNTVKSGEPPLHIQAELGKTRILTLTMEYSGNFSNEEDEKFRSCRSAAHGVWADPVLF